MSHHLIRESHLVHQCPYCTTKVSDEWCSHVYGEKHYKEQRCKKCERKLTITVDFDGSGHDTWAGHERWKKDIKGLGALVNQHASLRNQ